MSEIKLRLIDAGKIVGYERHSIFAGVFFISHSKINDDREGWEWWNILETKSKYIEHEEEEQYTGLKDKNGREIYEGDIVKYSTSKEEGIAQIAATMGKQNLYFQWISQKTESPSLMTATDYFGCASELEALGNIHENPELLA